MMIFDLFVISYKLCDSETVIYANTALVDFP